ncbi:gamma-glutamyl-gamma-aminobutyrate hydrolase [Halospina denitrificans]|uniref:gamma-glutamyl-gamma-aminobutyrate hydrolase n=1 Tax=Halospina denitrificans TaxID=332522 RepID=A0A4R7JTQ9_9GAMM|nr:gamma-glutamyl-gamma-aminobutyrate hydrolase family protein [Halospina denitrificans]TDT41722.1 gamma-glutamyl-gamma-aminobutyrate hydrolase [Halospina denitrificans]
MRPLIGITACTRTVSGVASHCVQNKYVEAVAEAAQATPILIPALGETTDVSGLLSRLDGILATGSSTGVDPRRYGGNPREQSPEGLDIARDATTLPLLREAVRSSVPVLAICRGHQELNVALGGTLHQFVQSVPGKRDHREDESVPEEQRYGPSHSVSLRSDGYLARLFQTDSIAVNSLHEQGIDTLAPELIAEAWTEDGLVEAIRAPQAPAFTIGVQWHPEWQAAHTPYSRELFQAFASACRTRASDRNASVVG